MMVILEVEYLFLKTLAFLSFQIYHDTSIAREAKALLESALPGYE
jgi:hypothetical protein